MFLSNIKKEFDFHFKATKYVLYMYGMQNLNKTMIYKNFVTVREISVGSLYGIHYNND